MSAIEQLEKQSPATGQHINTHDWPPEARTSRVGPIKNPEEVIGKQVFKRSGKPFKSRNKYNTVAGVVINPHTNLVAFAFDEDSSIVDVHKCNIRKATGT